jgi:hypothetical protein
VILSLLDHDDIALYIFVHHKPGLSRATDPKAFPLAYGIVSGAMMAPNFFPSKGDPLSDAAQAPVQNAAVAFMIEHCKEIFGSVQGVKAAR